MAVMGYTAYELTEDSRKAVLRAFPPRYAKAVAEHITVAFGVAADAPLPPAARLAIVGHADDGRGIEALVVSVDGNIVRGDGGTYHLTLSYDPAGGPGREIDPKGGATEYRAIHSNALIGAFGYKAVPPVSIAARPRYLLSREERATLKPKAL
jgi:hypothetical protein